MFNPTLVFSTNVTMQWRRVVCSERNSEITHYVLQHSLEGSNRFTCVKVSGTNDSDRMYTATRLQPLSRYIFTIAAVNSGGQSGPTTTFITMTAAPESKACRISIHISISLYNNFIGVIFQIHLSGVHNCLQWRVNH